MPHGVATYWKCDDLHCVFDIGPFNEEARALEIASQITSLESSGGKTVVRLRTVDDHAVDNTRVIFYKPLQSGEVDCELGLPGSLDWLLQIGYAFVEAGRPITIRVVWVITTYSTLRDALRTFASAPMSCLARHSP